MLGISRHIGMPDNVHQGLKIGNAFRIPSKVIDMF
jgi:hypothetical protein